MKNFDSLIFDLDGTLWDASRTSAQAWTLGLERAGFAARQVTREDIARVTGRPFEECVKLLFPDVSAGELETLNRELDAAEMEAFSRQGGRLFKGVASGLEELGRKYPLFLVSNCQEWYLESFFRFSGLRPRFTDFECYGRTGRSKADNIAEVKNRHRLSNPVYIGDTLGDHEAAVEAGVSFIHLNHGFGPGPEQGVSLDNFKELVAYLL